MIFLYERYILLYEPKVKKTEGVRTLVSLFTRQAFLQTELRLALITSGNLNLL